MSSRTLTANLRDCAREPAEIALVFQLNKRDLPSAADPASLEEAFRWPGPVTYVESVAAKGEGVSETLDALVAC